MLLASQLFAHAVQTLGGPVSPELGGTAAVVNMAGRHLMAMHPWSSAGRASALLTVTALQSYISLPSDFGAVEAINATNNLDRQVRLTTLGEILGLRTSLLTVGAWSFTAAVSWWEDTNNVIQPRLELWPTPNATTADAITLMYTARWVDLVDDNSKVLVPAFMEPLLIELVRAFARAWEMEDQAALAARLATIQSGPVMGAAMRFDRSGQGNLGQMRGSAVRERLLDSTFGWDSFTANAP